MGLFEVRPVFVPSGQDINLSRMGQPSTRHARPSQSIPVAPRKTRLPRLPASSSASRQLCLLKRPKTANMPPIRTAKRSLTAPKKSRGHPPPAKTPATNARTALANEKKDVRFDSDREWEDRATRLVVGTRKLSFGSSFVLTRQFTEYSLPWNHSHLTRKSPRQQTHRRPGGHGPDHLRQTVGL